MFHKYKIKLIYIVSGYIESALQGDMDLDCDINLREFDDSSNDFDTTF